MDKLAAKGYQLRLRQEGGDWNSLLTENRGGGLFGGKGFVVVDDAEKLGSMPPALAPLLEGPESSVVIFLVCKAESASFIPKEFAGKCSVSKAAEFSPWSKDRDDMIREISKRRGVSVNRDAVALLKDLFEDSGELASETEKLALFSEMRKQSEISVTDIELFCLSDGSRSLLKLLDGICSGNCVESLYSLDVLSRNGELLPLVSALHNRIRLAYYLVSSPRDKSVFAKALGARDYALRQADQAARIYGKAKLQACMIGLIRINANEKSGMGASWRDLNLLLIELMSDLK